MIFIMSMINCNKVGIWRIWVAILSLLVIDFQYFVTISSGNYWSLSCYIFLKWIVFFESFKIMCLMHWLIIHITQETRIILKTLMPSQERIVEESIHLCSCKYFFPSDIAIWHNEIFILFHILMPSWWTVGRT